MKLVNSITFNTKINIMMRVLTAFFIATICNTTGVECKGVEEADFNLIRFNQCPLASLRIHLLFDLTLRQCAYECAVRASCKGAGYSPGFKCCELFDVDEVNSRNSDDRRCNFIRKSDISAVEGMSKCATGARYNRNSNQCEKRECPPVKPVNNGIILGNSFEFNSRRMVRCNPGYCEKTGQTTMLCLNGNWNYTPECVPSPCTSTPSPTQPTTQPSTTTKIIPSSTTTITSVATVTTAATTTATTVSNAAISTAATVTTAAITTAATVSTAATSIAATDTAAITTASTTTAANTTTNTTTVAIITAATTTAATNTAFTTTAAYTNAATVTTVAITTAATVATAITSIAATATAAITTAATTAAANTFAISVAITTAAPTTATTTTSSTTTAATTSAATSTADITTAATTITATTTTTTTAAITSDTTHSSNTITPSPTITATTHAPNISTKTELKTNVLESNQTEIIATTTSGPVEPSFSSTLTKSAEFTTTPLQTISAETSTTKTTTTPTAVTTTTRTTTTTTTPAPMIFQKPCSTNSDCTSTANMTCIDSMCQCAAPTKYNALSSSCVTSCGSFGTTYTRFQNTFSVGTYLVDFLDSSVLQCAGYCSDHPQCAGFQFWSWSSNCVIKAESSSFRFFTDVDWYMRNCA